MSYNLNLFVMHYLFIIIVILYERFKSNRIYKGPSLGFAKSSLGTALFVTPCSLRSYVSLKKAALDGSFQLPDYYRLSKRNPSIKYNT